jgi:hypothetical protein
VKAFREHFFTYQCKFENLKPQQRWEELKWRANMFHIAAQMLDAYDLR